MGFGTEVAACTSLILAFHMVRSKWQSSVGDVARRHPTYGWPHLEARLRPRPGSRTAPLRWTE